MFRRAPKAGPHEHYCEEHDHRVRCENDRCLRPDAEPCAEVRCAKCQSRLVPVSVGLFKCPFWWRESGHDTRSVVPEGSLL